MLNIHNGDSTCGTARKAAIPGEHFAWREALVCGPTPGGLSADDFRGIRVRHLAESYGVKVAECEHDLREQEEILSQVSDHEEVVLWFEHDLFCQIHLIYLLHQFARLEAEPGILSLISIDKFPGIDDFRGLGQLNEFQLASLFPRRQRVTKAQLELGRTAWAAYSSSTPDVIEAILSDDTSALPFLNAALTKHLQRFPSTRNGLGQIENVLLELVAGGKQEFMALFAGFQQREAANGFGDAQVFLELKRLTNASQPLLTGGTINDSTGMNSNDISRSSFQITNLGEAVLDGDQDFIRLNGIDLWLGGTHLKGDEAAWRWDRTAHKLIHFTAV